MPSKNKSLRTNEHVAKSFLKYKLLPLVILILPFWKQCRLLLHLLLLRCCKSRLNSWNSLSWFVWLLYVINLELYELWTNPQCYIQRLVWLNILFLLSLLILFCSRFRLALEKSVRLCCALFWAYHCISGWPHCVRQLYTCIVVSSNATQSC